MRQIVKIIALGVALLPAALMALTDRQELPAGVTEVHVSGNTRLTVVDAGTGESFLESLSGKAPVATIKGNRMRINETAREVTIHLAPSRSIKLSAEDNAALALICTLPMRQRMEVHVEDNATAIFRGSAEDSAVFGNLVLTAEDNARITAEVLLSTREYTFKAEDNAAILLTALNFSSVGAATVTVEDRATIDRGKIYIDGRFYMRDDMDMVMNDMADSDASTRIPEAIPRRNPWRYSRSAVLEFGWGLHNWSHSANPIHGFEGLTGDDAIRPTFNNLHLTLNYPLCGTRHFGLYAGVGLEWDKYKFDISQPMTIVASEQGSHFAPTQPAIDIDGSTVSALYTRYIVVPLTVRFDLGRSTDWHLEFTAIPGLHWSGKRTGLRNHTEGTERELRHTDQTANRFINPYKLDARVAVRYEGVGLYLQVPMMSTMKKDFGESYFPVKFGLSLAIGD